MTAALYTAISRANPDLLPITVETAKAHCRVDGDFDNLLIESYIRAAVSYLERKYRISIFKKRFEAVWIAPFTSVGKFILPVAEVSAIDEIEVFSGASKLNDFTLIGGEYFSYVRTFASGSDDFRIRFSAGWESSEDLPEDIKILIAKLTTHYYENRGSTADRDKLDFIVKDMMNHYRF